MASEYTDEKTIIPKYATKLIVSIEPTELIVASASIAFILSGTTEYHDLNELDILRLQPM